MADGSLRSNITVIHTEPVVRPEHAPLAEPEQITAPSSGLLLRQCAGESCAVMATVEPGIFKAVLVEESDGWMLIQSAKGSGWIQAYKIGKTP